MTGFGDFADRLSVLHQQYIKQLESKLYDFVRRASGQRVDVGHAILAELHASL